MYCKHCGAQIDDDSVFCNRCGKEQSQSSPIIENEANSSAKGCRFCGETLREDLIGSDVCDKCYIEHFSPKAMKSTKHCQVCGMALPCDYEYPVCTNCKLGDISETPEKLFVHDKPNKIGLVIFIFAIIAIVAIWVIIAYPSDADKTQSYVSSDTSSSSRKALSAREQALNQAYVNTGELIRSGIKEQLKNPDTLKVNQERAKFTADNALFSDFGTAKYTNASGKEVSVPYEIRFIYTETINEYYHYYIFYLKMGDSVLVDELDLVDTKGNATAKAATIYNNVSEGKPWFDSSKGSIVIVPNGDATEWNTSSQSNTNASINEDTISYAEYAKIKDGMTYEEVCDIIGSYGKELSRVSVSEYETVIVAWDGEGMLGANANVTFQNGKVMAKAQFGLE